MDQAMRVPKLVLGAELTASPDPDAPVAEIAGFTKVSGRRGDLPEFSGVEHQPGEDVRILSTLGFINLPEENADDLHVPLLFQYRGDVIPSFALQAALDRKSTRLNSSHGSISYAVFCLKKKTNQIN